MLATRQPRSVGQTIWAIAKEAFSGFQDDRCLRLSASLAYYTIFSVAPLLVLMMALLSLFLGQEAIQGQLFSQMNGLIGPQAAKQLQEMIGHSALSGKTNTALVVSLLTLLLGATGIFADIQDSINQIWGVKAKPKKGWLKLINDRLLSSSLVVSLGFLLLVTFLINGLILALGDGVSRFLPSVSSWLISGLNFAVSTGVATLLFSVIFKVLPDVTIAWKDVRWGGFMTAILFAVGRYLIGLYIETTGTSSAYGAAGSLIVLLVWIYYMAAILYFGAELTQAYANQVGVRIEPSDQAVFVDKTERELNHRT